jgi:exonuclease III
VFHVILPLIELSCCYLMDPKKIMIWNVRGLNSLARQDTVRTLVEATQADIVCIQETKIANMPQQVLLSALGSSFTDYLELPAMGASGGILVAWRRHVQTTKSRRLDINSSSIQFCSESGVAWWLTGVYGPQGNDEKNAFMQELRDVRVPAMVLGSWPGIST